MKLGRVIEVVKLRSFYKCPGSHALESCRNSSTTHYRKSLVCRVPVFLSCVFCRAHGKEPLCRVPRRKRTVKKNTRQNLRFTVCWHTAKTLPCVFFWHTAKYTVCRVFIFLAHSKVYSLPCVFFGTRQSHNFLFLFSSRNFFYPPHTTCSTPC